MEKHKNLYHPVTIGSIKIDGNLFLAPLAGFTDPAFRFLCVQEGANLTFSEMVSAEGLARKSKKTSEFLVRADNEKRFAVQLFMKDAETAMRGLPALIDNSPDLIDINCGCPVQKVIKTGAGSALLKSPETIYQIVHALRGGTDIPITVKIRSGWDSSSINFLETADAACQGGAAMITIHARTREQGYSGTANLEHIKTLKHFSSVPVFGSGDLFSPSAALQMITETGVDGVMFARGAIGNPFIFSETRYLLETGEMPPETSQKVRAEAFISHLGQCINMKGEKAACREMRKHAGSYIKGFPGASEMRKEIVQASTRKDYEQVLSAWMDLFMDSN
ncbi:MAG: tRNA dihydrouridine synthase DusB [Spirochaetia bacterium]|nr:tRNA dihydrouridine synthase DusB [Spirochaetia bacterium]